MTLVRSLFPMRAIRTLCAVALIGPSSGFADDAQHSKSPSWCARQCGELVLDWNLHAQQVIAAANGYQNPLPATRALAMMHLAMHDAVNAAAPRYAGYRLAEHDPAADPAIAGVQAAHDVLAALYPEQRPLLARFLDRDLLDAGIGQDVARGVALGKRAAAAIVATRAGDGADAKEAYQEGRAPGRYRFVTGTHFVLMPHWRAVRPFALASPAQFRVPAPPALASVEYARAFEEVKRGGGDRASGRSADESHYAAFWYELSDVGWNRIARTAARAHPQDLWASARTFALLNAALADSYVAGWDSKMHHDFWRPVTAIRLAADDGNPETSADPAWNSFLRTPPVPDHPSTHSTLGAAAATVLAHAFGRDDIGLRVASTSADPANPVRNFASFSEAARENAESRIKAGLHFRFATDAGLELGRKVGRYTVANLLSPLH